MSPIVDSCATSLASAGMQSVLSGCLFRQVAEIARARKGSDRLQRPQGEGVRRAAMQWHVEPVTNVADFTGEVPHARLGHSANAISETEVLIFGT